MKTIFKKRAIAVLLALVLCISGLTSLGNTELFAADDYAACVILSDGTETNYVDFNDALDAWVPGSTLKLLKVITIDSAIILRGPGTYTLDLSRYGILQTCKNHDQSITILQVLNAELNIINSATDDYGKCYYLGIEKGECTGRAISYAKLKPDIGKEGEDYIKVPCGFLAGGAAYNEVYNGYAISARNSVVTLENISVAGNTGAGIEIFGDSTLNVNGNTSIIYNTSIYDGTGINAYNSTVNINDTASIKYNDAVTGSIYCYKSNLSLSGNAEVSNNHFYYDIENVYGGGIYIEEGRADISENAKIESNTIISTGNLYGGGIYAKKSEINISDNATIDANTLITKGYFNRDDPFYAIGGGIYASESTVTISGNATIGFNDVIADCENGVAAAGGVALYDGSTLNLCDDVSVIVNTATVTKETGNSYGGGVIAVDADIFMSGNAIISDNEVDSQAKDKAYGGGIYLNNDVVFGIEGKASVIDNRANSNKVAIPSNLYIYDCAYVGPISVTGALTGQISVDNRDKDYKIIEEVLAEATRLYNDGKISETDIEAFSCDDPDYKVVLNDKGQAEIIRVNFDTEKLPDTIIGTPNINVLIKVLQDLKVEGKSWGEYVIVDQDKVPVLGENTYILKYVPYDTAAHNAIENIIWTFKLFQDIADENEISVIEKDTQVAYTGSPAYQKIRLLYEKENYELIEGKDYTRECNSINIGRATTKIKGIGRFGGETEFDFEIVKPDPIPDELPATWDKSPWLLNDYFYEISQEESAKGQYAIDSEYYEDFYSTEFQPGENIIHLHYNPYDNNYRSIDVEWHVNLTHTVCDMEKGEIIYREATPYEPGEKIIASICKICGYWGTGEGETYYLDINDNTYFNFDGTEPSVGIIEPLFTIKFDDYLLQKDIDYTIFVNEETSCHALVTIKGCGNFTGEIKYEIKIDDHETELIEREGIESTCTTKGFYYKVKRCKKCYKEFEVEEVELPLKSHVEGNWEILVPATATTPGKRVKRCTECNLILESEEIPATGVPSGTVTPINNTPAGNGTSSGNNTPVENETPVNTGTPTGTDTPVSTGTPAGTENPAGTETPANTGSDTPADTDTKASEVTGNPEKTETETTAKTDDNPVIKTEEPVNKGSVVSDGSANADYEITSTGSRKNTAQYDNFDGKATTVEIPETVKVNDKVYSVTTLDPKAFAGNTVVKKVVLTDKITKISKNSFNGCTGLKKLVFGNNTKVIGANALKGCSSLTSLNITENVENIRKNAFAGCDNLKKLVIRSNKFTNESEIKNVLKNLSEGCAVYVTKDMKATYKKLLKELKLTKSIKLKTIKNS